MPFMFLQAIRTTCRLKIISKASCHNEGCSFTLLFRKVQLKNSYLPNSPKKICLRVLIVSSLSFSGREASSGRMWRPPGLSVLFVCQRPLLWLVCPGGTVSQCKNKKKKLSNGGATVNSVFLLSTSSLSVTLLTPLWSFRCGQRWECQRGSVPGQWLWSFNQTQQCLSIQHLSLYNISRGEETDVIQGKEWGTDGSNAQ